MIEGTRTWADKGRQMHIKQVPGSRRGKDKKDDKDKGEGDEKAEEDEEMEFKIPYLSSQDITPGKYVG